MLLFWYRLAVWLPGFLRSRFHGIRIYDCCQRSYSLHGALSKNQNIWWSLPVRCPWRRFEGAENGRIFCLGEEEFSPLIGEIAGKLTMWQNLIEAMLMIEPILAFPKTRSNYSVHYYALNPLRDMIWVVIIGFEKGTEVWERTRAKNWGTLLKKLQLFSPFGMNPRTEG